MATPNPTGLMLPRPSSFYLVHTPGPSEDLKIWVGKQSHIILKKAKIPLCGEGGNFLSLDPQIPTALYSTRSVDGHKAANRGWCAIQQSVHRNTKEF